MNWDNKNQFTRLTLEQSDRKIVWEVPFVDVTGEDMMEAINTIMVGMTFAQDTVYTAMVNYLENHAYNLYEIYDKYDVCEVEEDNDDELEAKEPEEPEEMVEPYNSLSGAKEYDEDAKKEYNPYYNPY